MTENPPPRPALLRSDDGAVLPAVPSLRRPPRAVVPPELPSSKPSKPSKPGKPKGAKGAKAVKASKGERDVELVVALPKAVRKQLRKKAEAQGYTAEEAAARLIMAWLET